MRKLPSHAKKVFRGTVFDVYQWKQKMFDGTFKTFENAEILDGVAIITTYKNKVVVLNQKQPGTDWYYTLPGGYLDHNEEHPKEAALRELEEETGLRPKKIKLWKVFNSSGRLNSKFYVYIAQGSEKVGKQKLDGGEIIRVLYKTFDQFLKLTDNDKFHNKDVIIEMLRARVNTKKKAKLKKLIFG